MSGKPRTIGPYELLAPLGAGGMGQVWKARDRLLNRIVALKFIAAAGLEPRDLLHEARAASALNHPNIVTIFQIAELEGETYLAMEFVEGESLRRRLRRDRLRFAEALDVAHQIANALASAHAHGIIHRDLKPDNIMLRVDGCVKLVDFGLAKVLPWQQGATGPQTIDTNNSGQLVGTFNYMSPEQARGHAITTASDVFSLGIVLYELFTGEHPFARDTVVDTLNAIMRDEPPDIAGKCPPAGPRVSSIVSKALRKDPAQRYPSAADLDAQLVRAQQDADTATLRPQVAPARHRQPWVRVAGSLGLVLLTLLTAWTAFAPADRQAMTMQVQSIAIMNFRTPPEDMRAAVLAEELPEDLGGALSSAGFHVASRSSVADLGSGATARTVGEELGVDAVVEGTVKTSAGGVRIYIEAVNVRTRFQIWSGTFTSAIGDMSADPTLAAEIGNRLRVALVGR